MKKRDVTTSDKAASDSRRGFLKGAVAAGGTAATLGAIGVPQVSPARAALM